MSTQSLFCQQKKYSKLSLKLIWGSNSRRQVEWICLNVYTLTIILGRTWETVNLLAVLQCRASFSLRHESWFTLLSLLVTWKDGTFELIVWCRFFSSSVHILHGKKIKKYHFAMTLNSKPSTDGIMDIWNSRLKGRTWWSIREGRAGSQCVWVYMEHV